MKYYKKFYFDDQEFNEKMNDLVEQGYIIQQFEHFNVEDGFSVTVVWAYREIPNAS